MHFETDCRSMRIVFPIQDAQNHLLKLDGSFWKLNGGQHRLKVQIDEPRCTVDELCQIVDQQVEELEAIEKISASRQGVEQEVPLPSRVEAPSSRMGQSTCKVTGKENGKGALESVRGKWLSWSKSQDNRPKPPCGQRDPDQDGKGGRDFSIPGRAGCDSCSPGHAGGNAWFACSDAQPKPQGIFCGFFDSREWEHANDFSSCKKC